MPTYQTVSAAGHEGGPAQADQCVSDGYAILEPGSFIEGKTVTEWTQEWWTWAVGAPAEANPFFDETGALAHQRNDGPVFFLAGTITTTDDPTPGSAERDITVSAGVPILVPIFNIVDSIPNTPEGIDEVIDFFKANTLDLFASIDGVSVADPFFYYEETEFFSLGELEADSLADELQFFPGVEPGTELTPAKAAGWYLMIEGLDPGEHELRFGGGIDLDGDGDVDALDASTEVTVHLRVVDHDPHRSAEHPSATADYAL